MINMETRHNSRQKHPHGYQRVSLSLPKEIYEKLVEGANRYNLSFSAYISHLVRSLSQDYALAEGLRSDGTAKASETHGNINITAEKNSFND